MDTELKNHCQTHPPLPPPQWCLIDVLEYNCSLRWFYISETLIFFVSDKDGKKKDRYSNYIYKFQMCGICMASHGTSDEQYPEPALFSIHHGSIKWTWHWCHCRLSSAVLWAQFWPHGAWAISFHSSIHSLMCLFVYLFVWRHLFQPRRFKSIIWSFANHVSLTSLIRSFVLIILDLIVLVLDGTCSAFAYVVFLLSEMRCHHVATAGL